MLKLLKAYKKRLANLTSRNRSLLLLRPSVRHFIDIHSFDFISKSPSFSIIDLIISSRKNNNLCPIIDPRDGNSNVLSKYLKGVWKTDQLLKAESGSEDLYIGYPFVLGKLMDGTLVRCPLLFFPVQLIQNNNHWQLEQKYLPISFNRTFLLAYSQFNQVRLEESFSKKMDPILVLKAKYS